MLWSKICNAVEWTPFCTQASTLCMKEWRRLPHVVSHVHLPYLQAAQQVMELQEACQIHQGLLHGKQVRIG